MAKLLRASSWIVLALLLPACGEDEAPSLVLITIDTLRADHLGCYGYPKETTPVLDGMAKRGARFTRVLAASPWTNPSVTAMVTGRYPDAAGVRNLTEPLPDSAWTLAERLQEKGYATGAVVSNGVVGPSYGHDQGYDFFYLERNGVNPDRTRIPGAPQTLFSAREVTDRALAWLEEAPPPFFLYVHYNDPHDPYLPPPVWRDRMLAGRHCLEDSLLLEGRFAKAPLQPHQVERLLASYDGEIAYTDHELGRLLAGLPRCCFVAVTGDHGEEFKEHGSFRHGHSLYQELLHVPLLLQGQGVPEGVVIDRPVSHVDLLPTFLHAAGLPMDPELAGDNLLHGLEDPDPSGKSRILFSLLESRRQRSITAVQGSWKLIHRPRTGKTALFHLETDPLERLNLVGMPAGEETLASLMKAVEARVLQPIPPTPEEGVEAREAELRALGYIE